MTTRAFATRLAFTAVGRDAPVLARVRFDYDFDAGLPPDPNHPLLAERQLEPGLAEAWVRATTPDGAWTATVGRQPLVTPAELVSIDGIALDARPEMGLRARAALGQRVEFDTLGMNGHASDDEADLGRRTTWRRGATILDAGLGWTETGGAGEIHVRDERRLADGIVVRRTVGAGARVGPDDAWHGTAAARHGLVFGLLERAEGTLQGPIGDRARLSILTRLTRPSLPLDSLFSVFAMPPRRTDRIGWSIRDRHDHRWTLAAHHAVITLREDRLPVGDHIDRRRAGGRLTWTSATSARGVTVRADSTAEAGDRSARVDVRAGVTRHFRRGPALMGDVVGVWRRDGRARLGDPLAGGYLTGTLQAPASRLATVSVRASAGGDTSNRGRLALLALLDLRLPGGAG